MPHPCQQIPDGSDGRFYLRCRRPRFDPWVRKIPWRREWQPTPVFFPGESPWTEDPGGLQSMGPQRVGHDWATNLVTLPANPHLLNLRGGSMRTYYLRVCIFCVYWKYFITHTHTRTYTEREMWRGKEGMVEKYWIFFPNCFPYRGLF